MNPLTRTNRKAYEVAFVKFAIGLRSALQAGLHASAEECFTSAPNKYRWVEVVMQTHGYQDTSRVLRNLTAAGMTVTAHPLSKIQYESPTQCYGLQYWLNMLRRRIILGSLEINIMTYANIATHQHKRH